MPTIQLFATDLDGTLIGNPAATQRFKDTWEALDPTTRPLLCYNSGRLVEDMAQLVEESWLPEPDYLIGGVGTEIVDYKRKTVLEAYHEPFHGGWNIETVKSVLETVPGIELQPEQYQNPYKSSWYLHSATPQQIAEIERMLRSEGQPAAVIYSSSRDLDVVHELANKGHALVWLAEHLAIATDSIVVAGDRGNDSSMYIVPDVRGILVENAQPELYEATLTLPVYRSEETLADGLIDGLRHYGLLSDTAETSGAHATLVNDPEMELLFDPKQLAVLSDNDHCLLETGYDRAIDAIRRNLTPMGFSACSLDDNEVTGTDVNYRSVWGRDGAITIVNTAFIDDSEIRACQEATLKTLLDHTSPEGVVPANVRIDDGTPDYSGVGGICAIDSGLWLVIAVYTYVRATGDLDLLRHYRDTLDRIMTWLRAHDSNLDGLIEIPEASDWTDLFGRSYNVLYDEVLWYRAHVCWGRMLEDLGDHEASATYLRQSQFIRGKLLRTFWPSTGARSDEGENPENFFADRQYSLGDARYLLAEISPFNFSWRCDVLGNVLAYIFGVLDADKARTALGFMWGVGVNDPWPVANLYPTVHSGDPDWRPYYTVNLLNLPHHYHNGGIWPFVGGFWVQFINRCGQHEVACHELVKLAECNRQGRSNEWEFNEWCHGETGRPMGKAYQAWSAATFLSACHELQVGSIEA